MPTPKRGYYNKAGVKIPSVTGILGIFKDPGGLMYWSWKIGCQAGDIMRSIASRGLVEASGSDDGQEALNKALKEIMAVETVNFRDVRDEAATIGTICHARAEAFLGGRPFDSTIFNPELVKKSEVPFEAFRRWAEQSSLKVVSLEQPMVSEAHQVGGTPDAAQIEGKTSMLDWKNSGGIYPEGVMQGAAYIHIWNENYPWDPVEGGLHIVRFSKEFGDFEHRHFPDVEDAWHGFLSLRAAYDAVKTLEKRLK